MLTEKIFYIIVVNVDAVLYTGFELKWKDFLGMSGNEKTIGKLKISSAKISRFRRDSQQISTSEILCLISQ